MRKTLLIFALMLAVVTGAAEAYHEMETNSSSGAGADEFVCELKSGATVKWQLTEQPTVELKGGQFVISSTRATVYYTAEDVKNFKLNKSATAIESVPQDGSALHQGTVQWAGSGLLVVSGCKAGEVVTVYAADGRQIVRLQADSDGTLTIATEGLPTGVYIVKSQSVNLKFAKK